ncbi:unnamed protein product [Cuscuta epithymum]|uniref:Reverse transcriptase n=1 Tax=Cuscuta epithymum TaxID=186058 RepID=A0AAV0DID9_9ASTE|nr:unnamed protein product [Cuscuta epithymum]
MTNEVYMLAMSNDLQPTYWIVGMHVSQTHRINNGTTKASNVECDIIKRILLKYEELSGQMVNFSKSTLAFSQNVGESFRELCSNQLGIPRESGLSHYLGLSALVGRNKSVILGYLKERIFNRIKSWTNLFLSRAGRAVLLRNVIQAMPAYAMNVFLLPKDLCDEIEKLMNGLWWKDSKFDQKGLRWRKWEALCKPKDVGGLGFRRIREFNLAMLAKQGWRLVKDTESLMSCVLQARYYPHSTFLQAKLGSNPSFIWRSIFETQEIIKNNTRRRVGMVLRSRFGQMHGSLEQRLGELLQKNRLMSAI